jgi:hypothetical protein
VRDTLLNDGFQNEWWPAADVAKVAGPWGAFSGLTGPSLHRAISRALKALADSGDVEIKIEVVNGFKVLSARIPPPA